MENNKDSAIVLYSPNNSIRLEVRLEEDTVWLSLSQMAELFQTTKQNISLHVNNIYNEAELIKDRTVKDFLTVQKEGNRNIQRKICYYNLDVIISVGYRVKSQVGTQFRIWANHVLKEFLINGYVNKSQLMYVEERLEIHLQEHDQKLTSLQNQVDFLVDTHRSHEENLFPTGCVFDAWEYVSGLVRSAEVRVILIDNFCDERTLTLLAKRKDGVKCFVYTRYSQGFEADLMKYNSQYPSIKYVQLKQKEHDRFLIIDDTVYILGDSIKDLGHSLTAVLKTGFSPAEILEKL